MTTDWVAPAAAAVAIAGIVAPVWSVRSKDRTDRQQGRRAEVYVDTLRLADQLVLWASKTRPLMTIGPPANRGEPPPVEQFHEIGARLGAFGSTEVERLYLDLVRMVDGFGWQDLYLREIEQLNEPRRVIGKEDIGGSEILRIMGSLPVQHKAFHAARDMLRDKIKEELKR